MEEQVEYNTGNKEESDERIIVRIAKYKTCEQCGGNCKDRNWCTKPGLKRSESIEKIAKANWMATVCAKNEIIPFDVTKEQWDEEWNKLRKDYKKVYYAGAEAALNALLEG